MAQTRPQYAEPEFKAPYRGWNSQAPANLIPSSDSPFLENFIIRNSELRTAPKFIDSGIPHIIENFPIWSIATFRDQNNVVHTVGFSNNNLYQLLYNSTDNSWLWNLVTSFRTGGSQGPFSYLKFLNKIYWTANNKPGVFYWDGIGALGTATALYGGRFIGEMGFNLIILNTIEDEGGTLVKYPQRMRWTPSGLPNQWDPVADPGAGWNDQLDVPDTITGFLSIGRIGFIFRDNGISHITLTGVYEAPFRTDHLWASERGIGNTLSQSIAQYGGTGIFISDEEIYKITISSFEPIGGGARDKIMSDIEDSTSNIMATILPGYHRKFVYLTYNLFLPQADKTILWIYHIEDKTWVRRVLNYVNPTAKMNIVTVK